MKLICIKEDDRRFGYKVLNLNEIYDGYIHDPYTDMNYWVINGINMRGEQSYFVFSKETLMPLSEYRQQQILSVINEEDNY